MPFLLAQDLGTTSAAFGISTQDVYLCFCVNTAHLPQYVPQCTYCGKSAVFTQESVDKWCFTLRTATLWFTTMAAISRHAPLKPHKRSNLECWRIGLKWTKSWARGYAFWGVGEGLWPSKCSEVVPHYHCNIDVYICVCLSSSSRG